MYDLDEVNPHLALWRSETHVSDYERRWERYVRELELQLGHSLDGDQAEDGYSLDFAHDLFADGCSVADAIDEINCWKEDVANGNVVVVSNK